MEATILCYHKVGPRTTEGKRLNIEPRRLESHVSFFARKTKTFKLAQELAHEFEPDSVCLTFDDAYESTMVHAPAILDKYQAKGSFFVVAKKMGMRSDWDDPESRPLASLELVQAAASGGHEIGNHSASHPRLAELPIESQRAELREAHDILSRAGVVCRSVCYPFGSWNEETRMAVTELGYRVGLSLRKGPITAGSDRLALPRIVMGYSDGISMLLYKLHLRPRLRKIGL
jgi:peptidoglycan/xylan/chitin deacetylase (PgdA/CDA1 family)